MNIDIDLLITFMRIGLVILSGLGMIRAFLGPSASDRLVAINYVITQVILLILLSASFEEISIYLDVSLVFVLGAFISTMGILKLLEEGRI